MRKLDFTHHSVVVTCDECPWWSAFAFDREEGWTTARRHELQFHEGDLQAAKALGNLLRKLADFREAITPPTIDLCLTPTSSPE